MTDTTEYSQFRTQTYRLAWLSTFSILAVVILMQIFSAHGPNDVLAEIGLGLFFAASLFSLLSRRFGPFAAALGSLILVGMSISG
jgi:hypothetical protein